MHSACCPLPRASIAASNRFSRSRARNDFLHEIGGFNYRKQNIIYSLITIVWVNKLERVPPDKEASQRPTEAILPRPEEGCRKDRKEDIKEPERKEGQSRACAESQITETLYSSAFEAREEKDKVRCKHSPIKQWSTIPRYSDRIVGALPSSAPSKRRAIGRALSVKLNTRWVV